MKNKLTETQEKVLNYIRDYIKKSKRPPTIREIGHHFGIQSTNGVKCHLDALERKGWIKREANVSRGITLLEYSELNYQNAIPVPLITWGYVAAGEPIIAEQNIDSHIMIDQSLLTNGTIFALPVEGNSMIEAGILSGDYLLVRQQTQAERGEIIIAIIINSNTGEAEATVKKYFPETDHIKLEPANKDYTPIIISQTEANNFHIAGKVIGLVRRL